MSVPHIQFNIRLNEQVGAAHTPDLFAFCCEIATISDSSENRRENAVSLGLKP